MNQLISLRPGEHAPSFSWALQIWSVVALLSLIVSGALSSAIRGLVVGGERWIAIVDFFGARLSQAAAISTVLLLVHLALRGISVARNALITLGAALVGGAPAMLVMFAHRAPLPHIYVWASVVFSAVLLLISAHQAQTSIELRTLALFGGLAILAEVLRTSPFPFSDRPTAHLLFTGLQQFFTWGTVVLVGVGYLRRTHQHPWKFTTMLGAALLLAQTVSAASGVAPSTGLLLLGRSLASISPLPIVGPMAPLAVSFVLLGVLWNLFARRGSLTLLVGSMISLGVVVPSTPLIAAWLSLCAFAVIACGANQRETSTP